MGNLGFQEMLLITPLIVIGFLFFRKQRTPNEKYNTFTPRFLAGLVDGLVFLPLAFFGTIIIHNAAIPVVIGWYVLSIFSRPVYTIWMHGKFGQTLGKMATGIILLSVDESRIINYKEAFLRESPYLIMLVLDCIFHIFYLYNPGYKIDQPLVFIIAYVILESSQLIWFLLEIITMLSNDKRRALHDYIAKSVVIKKEAFVPHQDEFFEVN